jgi:DNA primase
MPSLDFQAIREAVSISQVLDIVGFVAAEQAGDQVRGPCPVHGSTSPGSRSFSANLKRNTFQCFKCGAKGNQLDLYVAITKLPIHEAALRLCQRAGIDEGEVRMSSNPGQALPKPGIEKRNP